MAINKVVVNNVTKIDLTEDTVTADNLREGITAHNSSGEPITGTIPDANVAENYLDNIVRFSVSQGYLDYNVERDFHKFTDAFSDATASVGEDGKLKINYNAIDFYYYNEGYGQQTIQTNIQAQTYRTGSTEPTSSIGNDGDLYLVVEG